VALADARASLGRARALLTLVRAELVDGAPLAEAERYDVALFMGADPQLAAELTARALAPLATLRAPATRARLAATLAAWLRAPGQRKTVAHALGVHPQTVRYRMARLRELFGEDLDDPDRRFELQLALRLEPYAALVRAGGG
jgi:DNA-binding PucR family transcriptional regulator